MLQFRQYLSGAPVPEGAPLKCKAGFHEPAGLESIGTMGFTCKRCRGFYAHDGGYSHLASLGDSMIDAGRGDDAVRMVQDTIGRDYR